MECEMPQINSNNQEIQEILKETKTIVIIGCSPNPEKASNRVANYLKNVGYTIIPVYPKGDIILGEKVYRSLSDIPSDVKIDMVDIFRKPDVIGLVVDQVIERGNVDCVWTQLGLVNNDAALRARESGIKVVQNYCTKIEHANLI